MCACDRRTGPTDSKASESGRKITHKGGSDGIERLQGPGGAGRIRDQLLDELASRDVVFEQYDQPGIKTDERGVFDSGRFRAAWVKDPDGNTLALTEDSA